MHICFWIWGQSLLISLDINKAGSPYSVGRKPVMLVLGLKDVKEVFEPGLRPCGQVFGPGLGLSQVLVNITAVNLDFWRRDTVVWL